VSAAGESPDSSQASAMPQPPPPTGPTATPDNARVTLAWSASSTATGYRVKRASVSGGPYTTITTVAAFSYANTGLTNGTTYYYVVSAINSSGESANSPEVSATPTLSIPLAPTGLVATAGNGQVSLAWNASSGTINYRVKRSTVSGGPYATVATTSTTSYTNAGLTNGLTYYFVVSALNAVGESPNSSEVSAKPTVP